MIRFFGMPFSGPSKISILQPIETWLFQHQNRVGNHYLQVAMLRRFPVFSFLLRGCFPFEGRCCHRQIGLRRERFLVFVFDTEVIR